MKRTQMSFLENSSFVAKYISYIFPNIKLKKKLTIISSKD